MQLIFAVSGVLVILPYAVIISFAFKGAEPGEIRGIFLRTRQKNS